MRVWHCDEREVRLPRGHPFPMEKYALLRRALVDEGVLAPAELRRAPEISIAALRAVHDAVYVDAVLAGTLAAAAVRRLGFPWSQALVRRSLASVGGTLAAARSALADGLSGNLAGGTHHAHRAFGSGYCVFNDLAVAARVLLDEGVVERVLVLDLDVHQGDGTAAMLAGEPRAVTVSVHGARNFPAQKERSDVDLELADGAGDEPYLAAVDLALERSLARGPFGLALYQGGVDPLAEDRLGRLAVSAAGLAERDRRALARLRAAAVPVALTLGGGYARPIALSIAAHVATYRAAKALER
jgi:acetoin utilization deacetylase AcuC-like enzyme